MTPLLTPRFSTRQARQLLAAFRPGSVVGSGLLLSALNVVTGAGTYLYQIIMGALLAPADFAMMNVILAMAGIGCAPLGALGMVLTKHVASVAATEGIGAVRHQFQRWSLGILAAIAVAMLNLKILEPFALPVLRLPDSTSLWLLIMIVGCNTGALTTTTFLAALGRFFMLGAIPFFSLCLKTCIAIFVVAVIGMGFHGPLLADVLANAGMVCVGFVVLRSAWQAALPTRVTPTRFPMSLVLPVVAGALGISVMQQVDVLLAPRYFSEQVASDYIIAAVLGKAVLYLPAGIIAVILPITAASEARREDTTTHAVDGILVTLGLCGAMAIGYLVFGSSLMQTLYGAKFGDAGKYLQLYGVVTVPMALILVLYRFFIARGQVFFCWLTAGLAISETLVLCSWRASPIAVLAVLGGFNIGLAGFGCYAVFRDRRPPSVADRTENQSLNSIDVEPRDTYNLT